MTLQDLNVKKNTELIDKFRLKFSVHKIGLER